MDCWGNHTKTWRKDSQHSCNNFQKDMLKGSLFVLRSLNSKEHFPNGDLSVNNYPVFVYVIFMPCYINHFTFHANTHNLLVLMLWLILETYNLIHVPTSKSATYFSTIQLSKLAATQPKMLDKLEYINTVYSV
jgi:hypothetical protein